MKRTLEGARTATGNLDLTDQQALALVQEFHRPPAGMAALAPDDLAALVRVLEKLR